MNRRRIELARAWGRALLVIAGLLVVTPVLLWIASPVGPTPMFEHDPKVVGIPVSWLPAIGFCGMVFGLAWMWRIYKAPTRYEGAHWRFNDHN